MRVIAPDVGGGFGSKLNCYAEEFAACAASKLVGAPVKWIETRSENDGRPPSTAATSCRRSRSARRRDGRILAPSASTRSQNNGAYLQLLTPSISHLTPVHGAGRLRRPARSASRSDEVFTNTTPTDAYRGAGRPEATHVIERVDRRARRRARASTRPRCGGATSSTEFPYTTATGLVVRLRQLRRARSTGRSSSPTTPASSRGAARPARAATTAASASRPTSRSAGSRRRPSRRRIGIGAGGWESARPCACTRPARRPSSPAPRRTARATTTTWSQIVADASSASRSTDVEVIHGDTASVAVRPRHVRLALAGGRRHRAAPTDREGADKARQIAAHLLECSADDLEWVDGGWQVKGSPDRRQDDPGAGGAAWTGVVAARGHRAEPRGDHVLRPAELHVPVRHATSARSRSTARRARSRSSATSRSTTAATSSTR